MSKEWTPKRRAACNRRADGTFGPWAGGKTKAQLAKKQNTAHGIRCHVAAQWRRQYNRRPRIGDAIRTKTKDGSYHKQAAWYVYTRYGWRDSGNPTRPSAKRIKQICDRARPSRPRR